MFDLFFERFDGRFLERFEKLACGATEAAALQIHGFKAKDFMGQAERMTSKVAGFFHKPGHFGQNKSKKNVKLDRQSMWRL